MPDAFDRWIEWADKPNSTVQSFPAIELAAIMALLLELRRNRDAVNEAVRRAYEADAKANKPAEH
jgi:hypothetical protein